MNAWNGEHQKELAIAILTEFGQPVTQLDKHNNWIRAGRVMSVADFLSAGEALDRDHPADEGRLHAKRGFWLLKEEGRVEIRGRQIRLLEHADSAPYN